ncbi:MAG: 2-oxoglutarate dehydrogenase E1 subunit family protein, partial [Candidatus Binatia bacterium]
MSTLDFLARANPDYIDSLYEQWKRDPSSVEERWRLVFAGYDFAAANRPPADGAERLVGVFDLVHSFRELGHLVADLDPLGHSPRSHPLLRLEEFGFGEADLDRVFPTPSFRGIEKASLRELLEALLETYCGTLGVEYLDIRDKEQRDFLQERMEPTRNRPELSPEERTRILQRLVA